MLLHPKRACYITVYPHLLLRSVFCKSSKHPNVKMLLQCSVPQSHCAFFTASVIIPCEAQQHTQYLETPALKYDKNITACKWCLGGTISSFSAYFLVNVDSQSVIGIEVSQILDFHVCATYKTCVYLLQQIPPRCCDWFAQGGTT